MSKRVCQDPRNSAHSAGSFEPPPQNPPQTITNRHIWCPEGTGIATDLDTDWVGEPRSRFSLKIIRAVGMGGKSCFGIRRKLIFVCAAVLSSLLLYTLLPWKVCPVPSTPEENNGTKVRMVAAKISDAKGKLPFFLTLRNALGFRVKCFPSPRRFGQVVDGTSVTLSQSFGIYQDAALSITSQYATEKKYGKGNDRKRRVSNIIDKAEPEDRRLTTNSTQAKEVGIVIAACNNNLTWLARANLNCNRHDILIYERCSRTERAVLKLAPRSLSGCTSFISLGHATAGKAHHAYVEHIIRNWARMHPITAFLKDSEIHSHDRLSSLHRGISYQSLAADAAPIGRRGRATTGLRAYMISYGQKASARFTEVDGGFRNRYVSFRSLFAASAYQIHRNSKQLYLNILSFATDNVTLTRRGQCLNCAVLERLWADLMHCGDRYTAFHKLHAVEHSVWNRVLPRTCIGKGGPLMAIDVIFVSLNAVCLEIDLEHVARRLYLAGLLRWDVLLISTTGVCLTQDTYDTTDLLSQIFKQLGLIALTRAPNEYERLTRTLCNSTEDCSGNFDFLVENLSYQVEGQHIVQMSESKGSCWHDTLRSKGINFVKTLFRPLVATFPKS